MSNQSENKTHFGYTEVTESEKTERVTEVFESVAQKYDLMNDLMSGGMHRIWKWLCVNWAHLKPGQKVLDLAGGTGDLTKLISKSVGSTGQVVLCDINNSMLTVGRDRLINDGFIQNIKIVQADAEQLPFPPNTFDAIFIGFGLRNVTRKDRALASMLHCLKTGGQLNVLEFSSPTSSILNKIYDTYSFEVLPKLGRIIAGDSQSYQYLAESIRMHPSQEELKKLMLQAGFDEVTFRNLMGGIVAIHRGFKY
jgi:demethylmenaquinone methyltransferase/2-methoxy-6-polyprenyl-1,4-benzoquinol methylase